MIKILITASLLLGSCFSIGSYGDDQASVLPAKSDQEKEKDFRRGIEDNIGSLSLSADDGALRNKTVELFREYRDLTRTEGENSKEIIVLRTRDFVKTLREWSEIISTNLSAKVYRDSTKIDYYQTFSQITLKWIFETWHFSSTENRLTFERELHDDVAAVEQNMLMQIQKLQAEYEVDKQFTRFQEWSSSILLAGLAAKFVLLSGGDTTWAVLTGATMGRLFKRILDLNPAKAPKSVTASQRLLADLSHRLKEHLELMQNDCNLDLAALPRRS